MYFTAQMYFTLCVHKWVFACTSGQSLAVWHAPTCKRGTGSNGLCPQPARRWRAHWRRTGAPTGAAPACPTFVNFVCTMCANAPWVLCFYPHRRGTGPPCVSVFICTVHVNTLCMVYFYPRTGQHHEMHCVPNSTCSSNAPACTHPKLSRCATFSTTHTNAHTAPHTQQHTAAHSIAHI